MKLLARSLRRASKLRFRLLGLPTIKDLPTDRFNEIVQKLIDAGWRRTSEYNGYDAWIDYGRIRMRRDRVTLTLEWDNWTEGSIEGPRAAVEEIARDFDLRVTHEWSWADYDDPA